MTSTTTGVSRQMGLAIATAVTGIVLAAGVSVASLGGWLRPAQAVADALPASAPAPTSLPDTTSAMPQVVLVPIAPVTAAAQPPATIASPAGAVSSNGPSTARHTDGDRSEGARVPHGERDDD